MPQLRYLDDAGTLRNLTLGAEPVTVGRVASCQITFVDDMISREHSRIDPEPDGRYRIRDLGSRNKTHVNGQQVAETLLASGDVIRVGEHVIEFLDPDAKRDRITTEFLTPDTNEPPNADWIKIKAPLNLTLPQVEALSELAARWGLTSRAEDIADHCLAHLLIDLQAERGFVAVRGEEKHSLRPLAHRGLLRPQGGSLTPVSEAFVMAPMLQKVAGRYPQVGRQVDANSGYAATGIAAPLTFRGSPIGVIYLDRPQGRTVFNATATQYLAAAGAIIGSALASSSRRLAKHAVIQESAWTSAIQRAHDALATQPAGSDTFLVHHKRLSGAMRQGDFCSVVHLDEQRALLMMVDAGGQGIAGLAHAAAIRSAVAAVARANPDDIDLAGIVNSINEDMAETSGRQLVSCVLALADLPSGRLHYINAGMPPPVMLIGAGRLLTLDQPSLLLGIDAKYTYETASVELPRQFRLVVFSDGLIDAVNAASEPFGNQRAHDLLLEQNGLAAPEEVAKVITGALNSHLGGAAPSDDASIAVLGRN